MEIKKPPYKRRSFVARPTSIEKTAGDNSIVIVSFTTITFFLSRLNPVPELEDQL